MVNVEMRIVTERPAAPPAPREDTGTVVRAASRETARRRAWGILLLAAQALGAATAMRLAFVLPSSFPLNDGGLFYAMARDLEASGFRLPAETSYNGGLPFAYPPLGIYLAAALDRLGPWSLIDVMRFLPMSLSVLAVGVFALLAGELFRPRHLAWIAALWFALLPMAYVWVIMGGGVTRAVGQLFSLLALWQAVRLARTGGRRPVVGLGAFAGLTLLSHPEAAWFVAYSVPLVWLAFDRSRAGFFRFAMAGALGLAIAAPWLATVGARHGVDLLRPAADSGWPWYAGLVRLAHLDVTREPFFPLIGALALVGAYRTLLRGEWFLAAWVVLAHLAQARAADQRAVVPIALLAAVGVADLAALAATALRERLVADWDPRSLARPAGGAVAAAAVPIALFTAFTTLEAYRPLLSGLPGAERTAMAVVAERTPRDASFAVVTGDRWFGSDRTTEWFPALTGRQAVNVVQGYEWTGEFAERIRRHDALQACTVQGSMCLELWAAVFDADFDYVYIAKRPFFAAGVLVDGTGALQAIVRNSPRYLVLYDGPGALIAKRLSTSPQLP
jgi:hypothetical protein